MQIVLCTRYILVVIWYSFTSNWGTEADPDFQGYHNGNSDPRGFGKCVINVDEQGKHL